MKRLFSAKITGIDADPVRRFLMAMNALQVPHLKAVTARETVVTPN